MEPVHQLKDQQPKQKEICSVVDHGLAILQLLWSSVRRCGWAPKCVRASQGLVVKKSSYSEINDARFVGGGYQDVRRFDIAMHDISFPDYTQSAHKVSQQGKNLFIRIESSSGGREVHGI